jgi:hypothetical protein
MRYEDLVREPTATLRGVCEFLCVPYSDAMLQRRDYAVQPYTAEQHRLVEKPPEISRVTAWRRKLTSRQVAAFEHATGELLGYLGYELVHGGQARPLTPGERAVAAAASAVRRHFYNDPHRLLRRYQSGLKAVPWRERPLSQ